MSFPLISKDTGPGLKYVDQRSKAAMLAATAPAIFNLLFLHHLPSFRTAFCTFFTTNKTSSVVVVPRRDSSSDIFLSLSASSAQLEQLTRCDLTSLSTSGARLPST